MSQTINHNLRIGCLYAGQLRFSNLRVLETCHSCKDDSGEYDKYEKLKHYTAYIYGHHLIVAGEIGSLPFFV
ncbi:hypothetical protein [Bacillus sp. SKDU12]|uniref:hypothetical protein n=1 Tax=Bacillus sp. SKDU12 TaxID=1337053 RepID=UPI00138A6970